ncbi:alpha/beta hydrolase [Sphingobium aquiterrae]|uniref:alpha/beta hydrolase n=1 Tax=Sphingobium aquiterrae TaxID=2038656 RepID=UPI00301A2D2A
MRPRTWIATGAGLGLAASMLTTALALAPLATFNTLMPKDAGGKLAADGVPYGAGARRTLDIYAPARPATGPLPVVIFFYGGSWASGDRGGYGFVGRALAARGFITVIPDYRIGPETVYPGFVEDGVAALRWVRAHIGTRGGDPDRIVLAGHSAGAYIAAMLALDARWLGRDRAAVKGFAGISGPYDFYPFDVGSSKAAFGAWPRPEETQPITWAGAGAPPTLLLIGGDDETVRAHNSQSLTAKLKAAGVPVTLRRYAGMGHVGMVTAFARPFRTRAPVLADVVDFAHGVTAR